MEILEIRDGFEALSQRFRLVQAENVEDGAYFARRLMARAARLLHTFNAQKLFPFAGGQLVLEVPNDVSGGHELDYQWADEWMVFCGYVFPTLPGVQLRGDVGCMRWACVHAELNCWEPNIREADWHERALDYAEVCNQMARWCVASQDTPDVGERHQAINEGRTPTTGRARTKGPGRPSSKKKWERLYDEYLKGLESTPAKWLTPTEYARAKFGAGNDGSQTRRKFKEIQNTRDSIRE